MIAFITREQILGCIYFILEDIGGALGLILGLSVQSLVSTISKNIKRLEHKTSRQRFITALIKFYDRRIRNPKYKNGTFIQFLLRKLKLTLEKQVQVDQHQFYEDLNKVHLLYAP